MALLLRENICRARDLPRTDAVLMGRAEFLAQEDRDLVEAVLVRSQPTALVGRMMNVSPKLIRRRLHRICQRLCSKDFLRVVRALPYLDEQDAKLARLHFCQGISQRPLARQLGWTTHTVRRRLDRISAEAEAIARCRGMKL